MAGQVDTLAAKTSGLGSVHMVGGERQLPHNALQSSHSAVTLHAPSSTKNKQLQQTRTAMAL